MTKAGICSLKDVFMFCYLLNLFLMYDVHSNFQFLYVSACFVFLEFFSISPKWFRLLVYYCSVYSFTILFFAVELVVIFLFSFLIFVIYPLFFLIHLACQFYWPFQRINLYFNWFSFNILLFYHLFLCLLKYFYFFSLLALVLNCSSFSNS